MDKQGRLGKRGTAMAGSSMTSTASMGTAMLWIGMLLGFVSGPAAAVADAAAGAIPEFKLENPGVGDPIGNLGQSVAVDGNTMIVSAPNGTPRGWARVYVRDGAGQWTQEANLPAPRSYGHYSYDSPVSISGNTAAYGEPDAVDQRGRPSGSVDIFTRSGSTWTRQATLTASDAASGDQFGSSVSLSGDTVVIGAKQDDRGTTLTDCGAAYVFVRNGSTWTQQAKLAASDASSGGWFGSSVSVSGDTAVVGAERSNIGAKYSGSAYVFTRSGVTWTQQATLMASDATAYGVFGCSVSISGDTAVVGASGGKGGGNYSGSSYVFTRNGSTWTQEAGLFASDSAYYDDFGCSVAVSGDTVVVGAVYNDSTTTLTYSGSSYVFIRKGSTWTQEAKLTAFDAASVDSFGCSVAVSGNTIAVGAEGDDDGGDNFGSAYVFGGSESGWNLEAKMTTPENAAGDWFGNSVSVSGDTAIVGACWDGEAGSNAGAAWIFERSGATWTQQVKLTASDAPREACFGNSVSVSGNTALIGACRDSQVDYDLGSVYVFTRGGPMWTQQQKLTAPDAAARDFFGWSVSVSGDTAVVGSVESDGATTGTGAVYVFTRTDSVWSQQQKLTVPETTLGDFIGWSVSVSGNVAVVGATGDDGLTTDTGAAYIFTRVGETWNLDTKLTASDAIPYHEFGCSVSISGDTALVGARGNDGFTQNYAGAVYVFTREGSRWIEQAKLTASDAAGLDQFGASVSISGNTAVVGASEDGDDGHNSGSVYVFTRLGNAWIQRTKLTASDAAEWDYFGRSVAADAGQVLVGAPQKDAPEADSGAAYVYDIRSLITPAVSSFSINDGAETTTTPTVALNNACTNTPTEFMASEDAGFAGAEWSPYSEAPVFALSPADGVKTVYFKARNAFGESTAISDTILLRLPKNDDEMWVLF